MNKKLIHILVLLASCPAAFAKAPHPLCVDAQGVNYTSGTGEKFNPYLICNHDQFAQLVAESTTTTRYYRLGTDLDFTNSAYSPIGTIDSPFKGGFDGNGYTLSAITLTIENGSHRAPFARIQNAEIKNLNINGVFLDGFPANRVGGLAGRAENSTISNVHVSGLDMSAGDQSGGLVGTLVDSTIHNTSVEGTLRNRSGSSESGGLVGSASFSDISYSVSHVNIVNSTLTAAGGPGNIGGLLGTAGKCRIKEVYADGNIDYSGVHPDVKISLIGGLAGQIESTFFANAYYAGKISINSNATDISGLSGGIAHSFNSVTENIFWDIQVAGVSEDDALETAAGVGKSTAQMKKKSFWNRLGFDSHFWLIRSNQYPRLLGIDNIAVG